MGQVRVSKNFCIYWDFCVPTYFEIPCLIPGFSCTYFPSPFLYTSFSFIVYPFSFIHRLFPFRVLLGLSSAHLAFLFIFLSFFCFTDSFLGNLGVCFSGFMLGWCSFYIWQLIWRVLGFGWAVMIVGWCASFFRSPFFIYPSFLSLSIFLAFLRQN